MSDSQDMTRSFNTQFTPIQNLSGSSNTSTPARATESSSLTTAAKTAVPTIGTGIPTEVPIIQPEHSSISEGDMKKDLAQ